MAPSQIAIVPEPPRRQGIGKNDAAIQQLLAEREVKLQRQREEQLKRRREEKRRRKQEQMKGVSYKILKVGRHHFQDSDSEDDDPNRQFFVSDLVVKRAAKRVYVRTLDNFFAIRN
jgi:predicted nuclease of restriction endonuclease-like (RecB) superfamily